MSASSAALSDAEVERRVSALLRQMTLEEKTGQLTQIFYKFIPDSATPEERIRKGEAGSYLFVTDPAEVNRLQRVAVEQSRLHIPLLMGFDVIHGFRTIFPVPLALAASWDPVLVEQVQTIAAREAHAAGIRWTFAPMVDIARDPRWGRMVEGAGEDPFLGAASARAQVRGFQGPYIGSPEHVLACVKHFAGYGAADGGRDYDSSYIPDVSLWNTYLPPFHAAVQAGVGSVMSAYMDLNDVPATGNRFLLQDVLRQSWGFRGFVVSDAFAIRDLTTHGFARDEQDAAYRALTAGIDMDMGAKSYLSNLALLVRQGRIPEAAIDNAVRPVLAAKIRLGLFEHPYVDVSRAQQILNAPEHREFARIAARRSAVLLRNQGALLPLSKNIASLAVIGPLADSQKDLQGSWSFAGDPSEVVTVLQGIRNKLPPGVSVAYAKGVEIRRRYPSMFDALQNVSPAPAPTAAEIEEQFDKAVSVARRSDLAVLVLGEHEDMSGEGASRTSLDLPGDQERLLKAVVATGKPVVLVLINGRPLDLSWAAEHVPAILEAWYPGTQGGNAIADLLFGDASPGGKLPVTWPRSAGQIPIYYAHNRTQQPETSPEFTSRYWDLPSTPLYPFGYGLSYTQFAFSNLQLRQNRVKAGERLEVSVNVENTGNRAGDEVAQLYIHQQSGSASRPVRQLKGFQRITLAPGEKKTLRFMLGQEELSYWSPQEKKWVEEPADFDLWIGPDSTATLHATFAIIP
ncbi:MAG: beta-glucosidase BglX [Acidobacteriia bacterium]|nr:beta-glucosidase BglX [Terriglobia bacterium]